MLLVVLGLALVTAVHSQAPPCACANAGVNVRDAPCGAVIDSGEIGECYRSEGTVVNCDLGGTLYDYRNYYVNGREGWIADPYMNAGQNWWGCTNDDHPATEYRAAFLATVMNIDWPGTCSQTPAEHQSQLIAYLDLMAGMNMNAIFFQARTSGDAFFQSSIEPWSRYLTCTQGVAPNPLWDPLDFVITEAHARNIEVHAWLNPYRANLSPDYSGLAANHMANTWPEHAHPYGSYLWMDPGADEIVTHLDTVISDMISRYSVDGIHFDDYFYPYPDGSEFPDDLTWNEYVGGGGGLSRDDWRRDNVNRMVERIYNSIKAQDAAVKFSISPFGIYRPCHADGMPCSITGLDPYEALYADSKLWLQQGWVDIFAPQQYWAIDPPAQSYPVLLDYWVVENTANVQVTAATGVYKIVENGWPASEIEEQIKVSRLRYSEGSTGNIHYSIKYFRDNNGGVADLLRNGVYSQPVAIPFMDWLTSDAPPPAPASVQVDQHTISWQDDLTANIRAWGVYKIFSNKWTLVKILPHEVHTFEAAVPGTYAIRAFDRVWQQGKPVIVGVLPQHAVA